MPTPIDILRNIHRLTPEQIASLEAVMIERHIPKGTTVSGVAQFHSISYYVKKGAARAFYTVNGKEFTVSFAFDDEYLSIPPFAFQKDVPVSISMLEDTDMVFIPNNDVRDMLKKAENTNFYEALLFINVALLEYTKSLQERLFVMLTLSAPERYRWAVEKYPRLLECATVTQIASFLGVTKETLYRIRAGKY